VRRACQKRLCSGSLSAVSAQIPRLIKIWRANRGATFYPEQMHEQPQIEIPGEQQPERGPFSFALMVAAAAVVIVLAGFYLWPGRQSPSRGAQEIHPPFGPAERPYAAKIAIENPALSRAANFLNQEVTILTGDLVNNGERALSQVELTVEFYDDMNQIALRESRLALNSPNTPLGPGERRAFDVSFDRLPTSWNMQLPTVRVTGLLFAPPK
jgi:hypothetical protein